MLGQGLVTFGMHTESGLRIRDNILDTFFLSDKHSFPSSR